MQFFPPHCSGQVFATDAREIVQLPLRCVAESRDDTVGTLRSSLDHAGEVEHDHLGPASPQSSEWRPQADDALSPVLLPQPVRKMKDTSVEGALIHSSQSGLWSSWGGTQCVL